MASFGPYEIIRPIGAGGMGEVLLVRLSRQAQFEKRLVIKRILPQLTQNAEFAQMFCHEARLAALLSHQNIVQIFDFGEVDGQSFIAMEFVDGLDLAKLLARYGKLEAPAVLAIAQAALRGLDYAHRAVDANGHELELVHRDVAPKNLLLSKEGEVKWIDFGLAKLPREQTASKIGGTLAFMSPEQAEGAALDARADLFSMGVTLFNLLTGELPFADAGERLSNHVQAVRQRAFALPSERRPELGNDFDLLISRALSPESEDRHANAREMLAELDAIAARRGSSSAHELGALVAESSPELLPAALEATFVSAEPIVLPRSGEAASAPIGGVSSELEARRTSAVQASARRWGWWALAAALVLGAALLSMPLWRHTSPEPLPAPPAEEQLWWTLQLDCEPAAQVFEAQQLLGTTPLALAPRAPGDYAFEFRAQGYQTTLERLSLDARGGSLQHRVELEALTGFLRLSVLPSDALLSVNERSLSLAEQPFELLVGQAWVAATRDGYQPLLRATEIVAGSTTELALELEPLWARLEIALEGEGKTVAVFAPNGEESECEAPCALERLAPGSYRVAPECSNESTTFVLGAGEQRSLALSCPSAAEPRRLELRALGGRLSSKSGAGSVVFLRNDTVQFQGGGYTVTAALRLERAGATLGARVSPWTRFLLDGKALDSPLVDLSLRPGRHTLRLADAPKLGFDLVVPR